MKTVMATVCYILLSFSVIGISMAADGSALAEVFLVGPEGIGEQIGAVAFRDTDKGLEVVTDLGLLPPGEHGFHLHAHGSCEPSLSDGRMTAANAAGGHYDPERTGKHLGPDGNGHKGDLYVLRVDPDGTARRTMTVKRLKTGEIRGRTVMIHVGGDNYSDTPVKLGGGGARLACGVIQ